MCNVKQAEGEKVNRMQSYCVDRLEIGSGTADGVAALGDRHSRVATLH